MTATRKGVTRKTLPRIEIYGLTDPRTGVVRYVGKAQDAGARFKGHIRDRARRKTRVYAWIDSLLDSGLTPGLVVLDRVPAEEWEVAERAWIERLGASGMLTNIARGGVDIPATKEQRANAGRASVAARNVRLWRVKQRFGATLRSATKSGDWFLAYKCRLYMHMFAALRPDLFGGWAQA